MIHRLEIAIRRGLSDARGEHAAQQIRDFLHIPVTTVRTRHVYHVEAELSAIELDKVVRELTDPVLHVGAVGRVEDGPFGVAICVAYKPGVADPVGKSALVAIEDTLGRELGPDSAVYTSVPLSARRRRLERGRDSIAGDILANSGDPETSEVAAFDDWLGSSPSLAVPKVEGGPRPEVLTVDLSGSDARLGRTQPRGPAGSFPR